MNHNSSFEWKLIVVADAKNADEKELLSKSNHGERLILIIYYLSVILHDFMMEFYCLKLSFSLLTLTNSALEAITTKNKYKRFASPIRGLVITCYFDQLEKVSKIDKSQMKTALRDTKPIKRIAF